MAARKKDKDINLLPKDKFASSITGRVLSWLLSTFRIMVIIVEMVVMLAFLSRFWLDSKNSDLNDEIQQKQAQIMASSEIESEFRKIQSRLSIYSALTSGKENFAQEIVSLSKFVPEDIILTSINISASDTSLSGKSPSEKSIAQFMANLQSNEEGKEVTLSQLGIDKEDNNLITFTLEVAKIEAKDTTKKGG
jgi:Tfp pilus assembly protein PilN